MEFININKKSGSSHINTTTEEALLLYYAFLYVYINAYTHTETNNKTTNAFR